LQQPEPHLVQSDEALVSASQKQDRRAFEELVRRTARLVFSRIYLEVADAHLAEDLVQEAFLIAWRSIGQVTDRAGFRTWLLSVAHTVVIDHRRREGRKKRSAPGGRRDPGVMAAVPSPDAGPDEAAEATESRQKVLSALRSLPAEYREPLVLRYIAGADYETIGRELGLSNGSLRGMLSRGMHMLRERLGRMLGPAPREVPRKRQPAAR
jgi:RNA polymerase sigma-70 factor (ECF subfamily)